MLRNLEEHLLQLDVFCLTADIYKGKYIAKRIWLSNGCIVVYKYQGFEDDSLFDFKPVKKLKGWGKMSKSQCNSNKVFFKSTKRVSYLIIFFLLLKRCIGITIRYQYFYCCIVQAMNISKTSINQLSRCLISVSTDSKAHHPIRKA